MTFIHLGTGDEEALEVRIDDREAPAWRYPGCYSYTRSAIGDAVTAAGLHGCEIGWYHPRHQWWVMSRRSHRPPTGGVPGHAVRTDPRRRLRSELADAGLIPGFGKALTAQRCAGYCSRCRPDSSASGVHGE